MAEWISTQSLKFINNPEILEQADLRVFFKPTENEIPRIARSFYSSKDKEKKDWKSALNLLVRGQFICNLHGKIIQFQAPSVESEAP